MISALVYDSDGVKQFDDIQEAKEAPGTTWVRASDASTPELHRVASAFGIHPLSVEDIQRDLRPKTEDYPTHTFIVAKTAQLRRGETTFEEEIRDRQLGLFIGSDWLVTMSTERVAAVDDVWHAVESKDPRVLRFGADFLAYRVLDRIVDDYFLLLDRIEDSIEDIEEVILEGPDPDVLEDINDVRRDLLSFRKILWPSREAIAVLARGGVDEIHEPTEKYYRDVYDHLVQLVDLTETYRDLARGARDIYQNAVAESTNEVMKVLTVVATIFIPLTFVVGVYGMNFTDMPELGWKYAYPATMLGLVLVTGILGVYFQRQGWL